MKSKIFIVLCVFMIIAGTMTVAYASYRDIPSYMTDENLMLQRLSKLGIISGFSDGTFRPNDAVTRAQFAKMITTALKISSTNLSKGQLFQDVPPHEWYYSYVTEAALNGLIYGYSDGTFKPNKSISYEEGLAIIIRALGYSDSDLSGMWPANYIGKASELGLTAGILLNPGDKLDRKSAAQLIDRFLLLNKKGSQTTVIESANNMSLRDCIITNTSKTDNTLSQDDVQTNIGIFKNNGYSVDELIGDEVKILVDDKGDIKAIFPVNQDSRKVYTVDSYITNQANVHDINGKKTTIAFGGYSNYYYNGQSVQMNAFIQSIKINSTLIKNTDSQGRSYMVLLDPHIDGPYISSSDYYPGMSINGIKLSNTNAEVIKNGSKASVSDIKKYDVVKFSSDFMNTQKILYVYDNKVTGNITAITPDSYAASQVSVNGVAYNIGSNTAQDKLKNLYGIASNVTLLLDENNNVIDIVPPVYSDTSNIAVVLKAGTEVDYSAGPAGGAIGTVTLFTTSGQQVTYKTSQDVVPFLGKAVFYTVDGNGYVKLDAVPLNMSDVSIDQLHDTINGTAISPDAIFIDVSGSNDQYTAKLVRFSDLPEGTFGSDVLAYKLIDSNFGDVRLAIFNNILALKPSFGVITGVTPIWANGSQIGSNVTVISVNGIEKITTNILNLKAGDVVSISNQLIQTRLNPIQRAAQATAVDSTRIKVDDKVYSLASNVLVIKYDSNDNNYSISSLAELNSMIQKGKADNVLLYSLDSNYVNVILINE
ncbi:S-layer homology domain-containing protein [Caldanaerobius fijiensis DSM 17918]|uniref:S-layer homology domain-containing protein n=1 Tax=Caldanaerobius fijiensis DSM 17918 TaxID=1121256 RepID=A0A1M5D8M3_9THEO|nr:S-layer homology domain-containing protein [Caldanaerobius fijiensis]SHF63022.1 S-layer homology domain-containing protein [Caldanaerobius fijiensis DSM 17918]